MTPITATSGAAADQACAPVPSLADRLLDYLLDNPIKSLSTGTLVFGGLLVLMYFGRIGFMPDVNIESATSLLYAVALLGLFIGIYTMLVLVMPGWLLATARTVARSVGPWHLFLIALAFAAIWALALLCLFELMPNVWGWVLAGVISIGAPIWGVWLDRRLMMGPSPACPLSKSTPYFDACTRPRQTALWSFGVIWLSAALLVLPVTFIVLIGRSGDIRTASGGQAVFLLFVLVLSIAFAAWLIASMEGRGMARLAAVLAPALLVLVLSATGNFSVFSVIAVQLLGVGEINAARVVVSGKGCQEVNEALGQRVCAEGGEDKVTSICPVTIRTRIGSQVVLEFAPLVVHSDEATQMKSVHWASSVREEGVTKGRSLVRRVVIDKARVLSWQPLPGLGEHQIIAPPLSGPVLAPQVPALMASWMALSPLMGNNKQVDGYLAPDMAGKPDPVIGQALLERCGVMPAAPAPASASAPAAVSAPMAAWAASGAMKPAH